MTDINVILFDLGGVLVELTGVATMMSWSNLPEEELWHRWLHSNAVRAFESGKISEVTFAADLVSEFELDISPDTFLRAFVEWPRGPFDGAIDLLESLRDKYHLACLSNTNHLHWARFESETRLLSSLDSHFASHLIGIMKPDPEIYHHTIHSLGCAPAAILFLDDNPVNVDSARSCGMQSELVSGISSVQQTLQRKGLVQGFPDANL